MNPSSRLEERRLELRQRPEGRPVTFQSWRDLLFLHWKTDPALVQKVLPPGLTVDTFNGDAWIAIVPFLMRKIRPAGFPAVPYVSNFLELNVRTYAVNEQCVPGVWFTSLNADRLLAVAVARLTFGLPYHWAKMSVAVCESESEGKQIRYSCRRFSQRAEEASQFEYSVPQGQKPRTAEPGTLDFFLLERYLLFSQSGNGVIKTGQVHHVPYPIQDAQLLGWESPLLQGDGFQCIDRPPDHVAFSPGVDVEVFHLS